MKRILLAVSAVTILMAGMAFAEAETPAIGQPEANNEQRTDQGIASGQPKGPEANRPDEKQKHMNKMEDKKKSDYVMTEEQKKEWAKIGPAQNRTARINAARKHDRQGRHR